jgi:two-component system cell cycle response regulator
VENRRTKKIRLLGVDPSPSLRAVLERIGEECDMDVDLCATLSETRERLAAATYDLVVSAAELPDGDHLDVLASVRGESRMALAPVLLLIAGRSENMVREALDKGITEVFFKRDIDDLARYLENFTAAVPTKKGETAHLRALVVEDDRTLGAYYRELLMQHGFTVDHVPSGEAALWEAEQRRYDFILVDLVLSGSCSGTQFLRRLRQPEMASAEAVAIAMSAYDDEARRIEALRAGANAFIAKPVKEHELSAHIAGMAQRPSWAGNAREKSANSGGEPTCTRCQPCQLTPRESNICGLVVAGYSDKRIAEEMGVSYWTVRTHIAHAFKKCQVSNRVELVRRLQGN